MAEERGGCVERLSEGLSRTATQMTEQVTQVFVKVELDPASLARLEDILIESDLGPEASERVVKAFSSTTFGPNATSKEVRETLALAIAEELKGKQGVFDPLSGARPYVVLFVGVTGSGK